MAKNISIRDYPPSKSNTSQTTKVTVPTKPASPPKEVAVTTTNPKSDSVQISPAAQQAYKSSQVTPALSTPQNEKNPTVQPKSTVIAKSIPEGTHSGNSGSITTDNKSSKQDPVVKERIDKDKEAHGVVVKDHRDKDKDLHGYTNTKPKSNKDTYDPYAIFKLKAQTTLPNKNLIKILSNQPSQPSITNSKSEYIKQEKKVSTNTFEGPVGEIDYISFGGSAIAGGGGGAAITIDKNGKVYIGGNIGIGFDVGFSGKAGYIPDDIKPEDFISGTAINESIQLGPISGGLTKPYSSTGSSPTGLEVGVAGKVPIGGSITYGGTKEILDIKRDIVEPVKDIVEDVKDLFREKRSRDREEKESNDRNIVERVIRSIFG